MKQIFTLFAILFFTTSLHAQNDAKFTTAMVNNLKKMSEAKNPEDYQGIINNLERIAGAEEGKWQPIYYIGFIKTIMAFDTKDKVAAAADLELMTPRLEGIFELESVQGQNIVLSEIHTLMAMSYSAQMMSNPMVLGAKYGALNARHLAKAQNLNPENPRAWLLNAQSLFYTPEAFGGDKAKAVLLATKAKELFENEESNTERNPLLPSWGKGQLNTILANK